MDYIEESEYQMAIARDYIHIPDPPNGSLGISPEDIDIVKRSVALNDALPGLVKGEATALILDLNNLFARVRDNGFRVDWVKLKKLFDQRCDLRYCAGFTAVKRRDQDAINWVAFMRGEGYHIVTTDLKEYTNNRGMPIEKGNMDVQITIAAMKLSDAFAHIIIGTCDGDFLPLVNELREGHFRKVSVMGIKNDDWTGMNDNLIRGADHFYDMAELAEHISLRKPGP